MARAGAVIAICVALLAGLGIWTASTRPADAGDGPSAAVISTFTFVRTGIVFVDPGTSEIVWRNVRRDREVIGKNPWRNPVAPLPSEPTGYPAWRDDRSIVGHPDHDLVAWVETTADGERGDLVVVQASTGDVLARTAVPAPGDRSVVIASVDESMVYFATPDPSTGWPDMPGPDIWTWRWAVGGTPHAFGLDRFYNDVSSGTWAVYGRGVEFTNASTRDPRTVEFPADKPTDFGGALSPDGTYWYGAATSRIVDTTTGRSVQLPSGRERAYGWTGSAELTLTGPFLVCSAVTGTCGGLDGSPIYGVCDVFGLVCGTHLPIN